MFGDIDAALQKLAAKSSVVGKEFKTKHISTVDFAKKLLGQIVFLYFLQKKGWLGVAKGQQWGTGPHDFLRWLARRDNGTYENFFNDVLEPLFYDTLATDRGHEAWCKIFKCRIPFLNGGLFEPLNDYDWRKIDILVPNRLFANSERNAVGDTGTGILDVFDRYNFTINEAAPLEKDVAIDPEMLGKVFENLIEENRRKGLGSYYTPREIVHYMCQESLINYLDAVINSKGAGAASENDKQDKFGVRREIKPPALPSPQEVVSRADLETFVRLGDQISHYEAVETRYPIKMPKNIEQQARLIDEKLADIRVCDPAVGSGAFPVGMMTEIVRARSALTPYFNDVHERTPYRFKRHAIQNCLYGVDIDPGAVEIAKLRLWLSLVVDEEDVKQVKPLPNLFYKIVTGNSLLSVEKNLFNKQLFKRLEELKPRYFDEPDKNKKDHYKQQIEETIHELTNGKEAFDFEIYFSEVFQRTGGFDVVIANPPYVFGGNKGITQEDKNAYKRLYISGSKKINLFALFVERGSQVLRKGGALIYILPNTLLRVTSYANTRRLIVEKLRVDKIVDLDVGIFDKVTASTIIISILNEIPDKTAMVMVQRGCEDAQPAKVRQAEWTKSGYVFDIFSHDKDRILFDKLGQDTIPLGDVCSRIRFGVVISGNFDKVISDKKRNSKWKSFLEGDEIGAFITKYRGRFLHYKKELLHRSRTPDIFESRKIMIQRITGGETPLKATFDDRGFYNKESILNLILKTDALSYQYVLAVLNSRLANWFYKRRFTNSSKLTVNLSKEYVSQIPIKIPQEADQEKMVRLVDHILAMKQRDAKADMSASKREIDQLVYAIYGLTSEEIQIVEGEAKRNCPPHRADGARPVAEQSYADFVEGRCLGVREVRRIEALKSVVSMAKYFSVERIAELDAGRNEVRKHYEDLRNKFFLRAYKSERGAEFAKHGFCRRLEALLRTIDHVYELLPPELEQIPHRDNVVDATIAIQAFTMNAFGCLENIAWIWFYEKDVKNRNGTQLDAREVGLGKKKLRKSLTPQFRAYLDGKQEWFGNLISFRDSLAHRIPLFIPPYVVPKPNVARYNELEKAKFAEPALSDPIEYEKVKAEQLKLCQFLPGMTHSVYEEAPQVEFHGQLLNDYVTIDEYGRTLLQELDRG